MMNVMMLMMVKIVPVEITLTREYDPNDDSCDLKHACIEGRLKGKIISKTLNCKF
jgi:hypothetical protein